MHKVCSSHLLILYSHLHFRNIFDTFYNYNINILEFSKNYTYFCEHFTQAVLPGFERINLIRTRFHVFYYALASVSIHFEKNDNNNP